MKKKSPLSGRTKEEKAFPILLEIARRSLSCTQPKEIDYREYLACEKCFNCQQRKQLHALGYTEFWGK